MGTVERIISFDEVSDVKEWRSWLLDRIFFLVAVISPIGIVYSYLSFRGSENEQLIPFDILVLIPFYLKFL